MAPCLFIPKWSALFAVLHRLAAAQLLRGAELALEEGLFSERPEARSGGAGAAGVLDWTAKGLLSGWAGKSPGIYGSLAFFVSQKSQVVLRQPRICSCWHLSSTYHTHTRTHPASSTLNPAFIARHSATGTRHLPPAT